MKNKYDVLIKPVISEKSMLGGQDKKYTFIVHPSADKVEIKKAVEEIFEVQVKTVNTANYIGKKKRQGRSEGMTSGYKKAVVTLKKDSKEIEGFAGV
jgi:large subunit ribosomal protein L23